MQPIALIGSAYQSRSENYSSQRSINWMLEPGKGKSPAMMIGTPGLTAPLFVLSGGGIRGMFKCTDTAAVIVCGTNVWKVSNYYATTLLGTIVNDDRLVGIAWNGTDLMVRSIETLYRLTLSGSVATVVNTGIGMVDTLGDFFIASQVGTNFFVWSNALTTTFDPLNIQTTNSVADQLVGCRVARRTAYFFGTKSLEPWYESGGADVPFSRIDGGVFEVGCIAKNSIAKNDAIFWLGGDDKGQGIVWTVSGGSPKPISTPAIEYAISQWSDKTDAYAFCYNQQGHSFYVLSSISGNQTWVYDITTNEWHQRAYLEANGSFSRIRPSCFMNFNNIDMVGDWQNGNVYGYDMGVYTDNGNPLVAIRASATLQNNLDELGTKTLKLDMDTGVGLTTGQGSAPLVSLRWSKDGGKTWSSALTKSLGAIGKYAQQVYWNRIGGGRRLVLEVKISDPVKRNITGAFMG